MSSEVPSQIDRFVGLLFMTIRLIVLFVHILGVVALFVALAEEWLALKLLRAADGSRPPSAAVAVLAGLPRFTGTAVILILASGIYLAAQFGVLRSGWVGVSLAAMALMGALGGIALRPLMRAVGADDGSALGATAVRRQAFHPFLPVSFRTRVGVALAIVYLMIAKPDFIESVGLVLFAIIIGALSAVATGRHPTILESQRTPEFRN